MAKPLFRRKKIPLWTCFGSSVVWGMVCLLIACAAQDLFAFEDSAMPEPTVECGTSELSQAEKTSLANRWPNLDQLYLTPHFLIHYTLEEGDDQILGAPSRDYVARIASYLEDARVMFHGDPETNPYYMLPPLGDGSRGNDPEDLPSDLIDVYIEDLSVWGMAEPVRPSAHDSVCTNAASGIIYVDNDLSDGSLHKTTVHEYFHLIQFGYGGSPPIFLMESTAKWAEKKALPQIPVEHWALQDWFATPYLELSAAHGPSTAGEVTYSWRKYGAAPYWFFQEERSENESFVPELWARICEFSEAAEQSEIPLWRLALDDLLGESEHEGGLSPFNETLAEFALWNCETGGLHDGRHYRFGCEFPSIASYRFHTRYPNGPLVVEVKGDDPKLARPTGSNYVRFESSKRNDELTVSFDGNLSASQRSVAFVLTRFPHQHVEWSLANGAIDVQPDADGDVTMVVSDWHRYDLLTMIVTNFDTATDSSGFSYTVEETGNPVAPEVTEVIASPNPFKTATTFRYSVIGTETSTSIDIFNVNGRHIRRVGSESVGPGSYELEWDGRDERGWPVASGKYFFRMHHGDEIRTGAIVILK